MRAQAKTIGLLDSVDARVDSLSSTTKASAKGAKITTIAV